MSAVEANVAAILDEERVAINAGENQGVVLNSPVTIWRRVFVKDPGTGEVLGHVDLDALKMRIIQVDERLSVARVPSPTINIFNFAFTGPRKKIRSDDPGEDPQSVRIGVGDRVTIDIPDESEESPSTTAEAER